MELILKNDVPNLGFKDDLVSVKNGYGRNYLIPQGLAILATTSSKKVLARFQYYYYKCCSRAIRELH